MNKEYKKEYYQKNKDKWEKYKKNHREKYPDYKNREKENRKAWYDENKREISRNNKIKRREAKLKIVRAYGNKCSCCGEEKLEFLTLDHINGGGKKERKKMGNSNDALGLYLHLIKNDYPKGYQILCFNCNIGKGLYGKCPHKIKSKDL